MVLLLILALVLLLAGFTVAKWLLIAALVLFFLSYMSYRGR